MAKITLCDGCGTQLASGEGVTERVETVEFPSGSTVGRVTVRASTQDDCCHHCFVKAIVSLARRDALD